MGRLHHVGIAVAEIASATEVYRRVLGVSLTTGVISDERQNVKVAFAETEGGVLLEFVEPLATDSPVSRIVERGQGPYHVCYLVRELEGAVQHAREAGALLVVPPVLAKAFPGRRIAFIYLAGAGLIEFLEE